MKSAVLATSSSLACRALRLYFVNSFCMNDSFVQTVNFPTKVERGTFEF